MRIPGLILALASAAIAETPATLTIEHSLKSRQATELRFSPDSKRVAFTLREPPEGKIAATHVWVLETASGQVRQWTSSTKSESQPRWSPDGKWLAFLSDRQEHNQLWLMPVDGGESRQLTTGKNTVRSFRWSPDSKRIAFLAPEPPTEAEQKKQREQDDARVIDVDNKPARVWTVDVATLAVKQETKGAWSISDLDWMPDGARILVIATDRPAEDRHTNRILLLSLADGKLSEVLAPTGPFGNIRVSPAGSSFAYVASPGDGPSQHDLFVCRFDDRKPRNLTGPVQDRPVHGFDWLSETELAALFANGFHTTLEAVGGKARKLILDDSLDATAFTVSPNGAVAYVAGAGTTPQELFLNGKRVSHLNQDLAKLPYVRPELYRYASFDGKPIEAALFRPSGAIEGKALPVIAWIHGGPTGNFSNQWDGLVQLLVARGYVVFEPNIRGSSGYGHKFIEANRADWGGGDFKDVMAGVDDLVRRKIADPARLGIGGWSYGGYMAAWAITQTDRFKCAIAGAGLSDLATEYGTEQSPVYDEWFFGVPYESAAAFQKSSPITYIKNARTPTLILQGEMDTTDPISQSQILYRGLKRYHVPAEFVVYPREPHGLREQKHIIDRYTRTIAWFDKYLKPAEPAPTAP